MKVCCGKPKETRMLKREAWTRLRGWRGSTGRNETSVQVGKGFHELETGLECSRRTLRESGRSQVRHSRDGLELGGRLGLGLDCRLVLRPRTQRPVLTARWTP